MHQIENIFSELKKKAISKGINYSLINFKKALKILGNPHKKIKNIIHIAGTNGKGSTLTFLASALSNNDFKVGTYTSPHLFSYQERIAINSKPIEKTDFLLIYHHLEKKLADFLFELTEFEIITLIAFHYFKDKKLDFVILETGLGGRFDATNAVNPILTIITKIAYDHQAILGKKLTKIAFEKAGIIKKNTPLITINQKTSVINVLKKVALKKEALFYIATKEKKIPSDYLMNASYQKENLALAKKSLKFIKEKITFLDKEKINQGLKIAKIKGRYQKIITNNKTIIIDSAHNPNGIKALLRSFKQDFPDKKPTFIIGILKTKNAKQMLDSILLNAKSIYYVDFSPKESYSYHEIKKICSQIKELKLTDPLPEENLLIITGSIYFLGSYCYLQKYLVSLSIPKNQTTIQGLNHD
ncbi:MAG: cyanophycin synthetase [Candidatus Margulisiibacteriota bacterium]|jgi:dihydrofolate synthase/folylpolyglutamate synthase